MSDNLKIQKFKIITIKKFSQKLKVCCFSYINCKCKDRPTFGALSNQGLCHLCSAANTIKNISEINLERKNQNFWFMEKHLSYNFHLWKNVYYRDFIQLSVRMALYGIV